MKFSVFVVLMLMIVSPVMGEEVSWMDIQLCKSHQIMQHSNEIAAGKMPQNNLNKLLDDCYQMAGKRASYWKKYDQNNNYDSECDINIKIESPTLNPLRHINPRIDGIVPNIMH